MWKYVSRRVRDTIERSANYFDKRSTTGLTTAPYINDEKNKSSAPCCWSTPGNCWNSFRNDNTKNKRWNFEHLNSTWLGAITWSGVIVLGWYATQLVHLKHKYRYRHEIKERSTFLLSSLHPYALSVSKNAPFLNSAPSVEKVIGNFIPRVHLISNDQDDGIESETPTSSNVSSSTPESSDNELSDVLNSIENKLGSAAIQNGQHKEGLNLLRSAANRHYAPAMYNLGLCYELGLGVTVDEKMAMDLYRSAALQEHPDAMYNLGIYYGQGRGGLSRDKETATRLLRLAALKGKEEAKVALKFLNIDEKEPSNHQQNDMTLQYPYASCAQNDIQVIPAPSNFYLENVSQVTNMNCAASSVC